MSSSGINAINSGPLIIRSYFGSSINNTYALGDYDIPISSNRVLVTSTNGLVTPSDNIYISSITISSINGGPYTPGGALNAWALLGNAGTVDNTNFLGTTDNIPFNIKVNNQKSGRIDQFIGNTFFGYLSNVSITTGLDNTAFGDRALGNNTTGNQNTAVGHNSLRHNSNKDRNTAVGALSLSNNLYDADLNTAVGYSALSALTSGNENIGIGYQAQVPNPIGNHQIAIGTANETMYIQGGFNYNVGTPITDPPPGGIILSGVLSQFYTVDATTSYTIYLPAPGTTYRGTVVNFRKIAGTSQIIFTCIIAIIPYNSPIPALGPTYLTATQYSTTLICDGTTWYQMQTV